MSFLQDSERESMKGSFEASYSTTFNRYILYLVAPDLTGSYTTVTDDRVEFAFQTNSAITADKKGSTVTFAAYSYEDTERLIKMFEFAALVLRDLQECGGYHLRMVSDAAEAAQKATGIDPSIASADRYGKWANAERKALRQAIRQRLSTTEIMDKLNSLAYGAAPADAYLEDTDW